MPDALAKIIERLTSAESSGFLLFIGGVLCVLLAAAGGSAKYDLVVSDPFWRYALGALGAGFALVGSYLLSSARGSSRKLPKAADCKITIDYPQEGIAVRPPFQAHGECKSLPAGYRLWMFGSTPKSSGRTYWPKDEIIPVNGKWHAEFRAGSFQDLSERRFSVFLVGESAVTFIEYYQSAGEHLSAHASGAGIPWAPLPKLLPDMIECASRTVRLVSSKPSPHTYS
ncbi:hypothetical protein [Roseomonas sp. BN140053]|uniref:hypothetical protein n=1 Tax=Roseomonas sp. BN140053 TaxID=3391898 RepID=UPI0039EAA235